MTGSEADHAAKAAAKAAVDGAAASDGANALFAGIRETPLCELTSISKQLGRRILAKCEHLHPGGSVKDRAAMALVASAELDGSLKPGGTIVQPTGGNTGVSLAMIARARGYKCHVTFPENISRDKVALFKLLGAETSECPLVPFADERHYVKTAERVTKETPGAVLPDQFENLANGEAHYHTTGPEIWKQAGGKVDGFVCAAGTGGTISGCSRFLKEKNSDCVAWLIDPTGSGLKSFVDTGVFSASGSCFIDGIGITRKTANFACAKVDGAFRGTDTEAVEMGHYLLRNEGLFVGPSAALNVCGAVKLAKQLPPGSTVVTLLCDGGERYKQVTYNPEFLKEKGLEPQATGTDLSFVTE
eukprot:TRINITY_DN13588_c0_g1_i1.p1 TRINITY_DN13588_c0_g1~~TRINITY_DN13588_c0_g1_i1.p1  ORF type:complete len:381 (+),score=123.92 TRINITY_DN13588_c0_g1_i1:69-1145(+)